MALHRGHIRIVGNRGSKALTIINTYQVIVVTLIPVYSQIDAIVEESCIQSYVKLMFLLIGQIVVLVIDNLGTSLAYIGEWTPSIECLNNGQGVADRRRSTIGSKRIAGLERKVRDDRTYLLPEFFLMCVPCG